MSRCWALALRCSKFVVELLWDRPLVVSVAGVRVVEFGPNHWIQLFFVNQYVPLARIYITSWRQNVDSQTERSQRQAVVIFDIFVIENKTKTKNDFLKQKWNINVNQNTKRNNNRNEIHFKIRQESPSDARLARDSSACIPPSWIFEISKLHH